LVNENLIQEIKSSRGLSRVVKINLKNKKIIFDGKKIFRFLLDGTYVFIYKKHNKLLLNNYS